MHTDPSNYATPCCVKCTEPSERGVMGIPCSCCKHKRTSGDPTHLMNYNIHLSLKNTHEKHDYEISQMARIMTSSV